MDDGKFIHAPEAIPQWSGMSEVAFVRALNEDTIAACRTDAPTYMDYPSFDEYSGLGICMSPDNGLTWTARLRRIYAYGRHHPSMVVLANSDIVMSYVVRFGYYRSATGYPRFGVEAVVGHFHPEADLNERFVWDLDHRYFLAVWEGKIRRSAVYQSPIDSNEYQGGANITSSALLPDGTIITAFGTGIKNAGAAYDRWAIGLVKWRLNDDAVNSAQDITEASEDSDLRNNIDPPPNSITADGR